MQAFRLGSRSRSGSSGRSRSISSGRSRRDSTPQEVGTILKNRNGCSSEISHTWTINNFLEHEDRINSPPINFHDKNVGFELELFPNGVSRDVKDYVSVVFKSVGYLRHTCISL